MDHDDQDYTSLRVRGERTEAYETCLFLHFLSETEGAAAEARLAPSRRAHGGAQDLTGFARYLSETEGAVADGETCTLAEGTQRQTRLACHRAFSLGDGGRSSGRRD